MCPKSCYFAFSRNILLARGNVVKISDFGLSKYVEYKDYYKNEKERPLPIKWLSLETLTEGVYTIQSDVWSYGVVLWELFSLGDTPYPGIELNDIRVKVVAQGLRLSRPEHALDCIYQVMQECQNDDPNNRPNFLQLKNRFQRIESDYKSGRLSISSNTAPNYVNSGPEPRSAFANSLYFNTSGSEMSENANQNRVPFLNLPQNLPQSPMGSDGYLLPSPMSTFGTAQNDSYLQLQRDDGANETEISF